MQITARFQPMPKERISLFFGVKTSLVPHDKVNNERNQWNRAFTPPSKNSCNLGKSKCINNYAFMWECSDIDFLPKSDQACSCHLVNTHNLVTCKAFDSGLHNKIVTLIVSLIVTTENAGGH